VEHDYDFEIRAFPKIAGEAHVYCRAVNAIIEDGDQICKCCPLATATSDRCRYFRNVTMIPMETNIEALPEMMDRMIAQGAESRFPRFLASSDTLKPYRTVERALQYAADAHAGLFRKGTHLPYIIHPIEVSMIVRQCFPCEDGKLTENEIFVIAAAALHDVVEDTPHTIEDIRAAFGDRIAGLVASESENKREEMPAKDSWKIRKQEFLDHLASASMDSKLIALADKLSNLRALAKDYARQGDALWQRFNQKDPKEHEWYYRSVLQKIQELDSLQCYQEYAQLLNQVFGDEEKNTRGGLPSKAKNPVSSLSDLQVDLQLLRLMFPDDDTLR